MKIFYTVLLFRKIMIFSAFMFVVSILSCSAQYRPGLFFREDWKEIPAATPVTQAHVMNRDLILGLKRKLTSSQVMGIIMIR